MSVLDLPIERQRQMADEEGMTLEQWRKDVAESLERGRKFAEQCIANAIDPDTLTPEELAAEDQFQDRIDSGNPR